MTPRDDVLSSTTSMRSSTGSDPLAGRATPEPTVLSTIWEGPGGDRGREPRRSRRNVDVYENVRPLRFLSWLLAPVNRSRALVMTTLAALVCAGTVSAVELYDQLPSSSVGDEPRTESSQGTIASGAVAVDPAADGREASGDADSAAEAALRQAISADNRIRLTAEALESESRTWMVQAEIMDPADPEPTVVFTVNGVVIEQVDQSPHRLLLTTEIIESRSDLAVGPEMPLIITASARWSTDDGASPATLVLAG